MIAKIVGVYKITSPSKRVYIGQSMDLLRRKNGYKNKFCKNQRKLYYSILKYGWENHEFEIIHICEPSELNALEKYYIELFQTFNSEHGLNLREGGGNVGKASEETLKIMSSSIKKAWIKRRERGLGNHSEEQKIKNSESRKIAWQRQKEDKEWNSPQEVEKRSLRAKNKKSHSVSNQGKENMKKGWIEYKNSLEYNCEEAKEKRRKINLGKEPWNKGTKGVMVAWNKGVPPSEEQKRKNSESGKIDWQKRKASGKPLWSAETLQKRSVSMKKFHEKRKAQASL